MKLYHAPLSRSARPLIVLEEIGASYEVELVSLARGEQKSEAHRRLHPLGQLPVLVDGDVTVFESVAICLYLADRYPNARLSPPVDSPERALYYQWCAFVPGSLEPAMSRTYLERQGSPSVPGTPSLDDVLDTLATALDGHPFLLSFGYSVADILVGATIALLPRAGVELPRALRQYVARLRERPAFDKGIAAS